MKLDKSAEETSAEELIAMILDYCRDRDHIIYLDNIANTIEDWLNKGR